MARARQILLVKLLKSDEEEAPSILSSVPLGTLRQVQATLSEFNTSADGSNSPETFGVLYGPGFLVQLPMVGPADPVSQVIVSLHEEDIAWPVLVRICRTLGWKMMDPQSGRTFGG
ncbi:MAG: hypothetical protein SFZ24_08065 [Planctomycetota bacterium]|nr:hypothetical protein [Planctomycetota bacterium]